MIKVGEETAKIGETVIKIGDFYDEEVDIAVGALQKSLEPIIIFLLAFVI
jgi:type II secretory pathway component PulF